MNWRTVLFGGVLLSAVIGLWWLLSGEQAGDQLSFTLNQQQQKAAGGSDYYMEGVHSRHFDLDGALSHELLTPRIDHNPTSAQITMHNPEVLMHNADGEPWQLTAQRAIADDARQQFELTDDVQLRRGRGFVPNMTMTTDQLQLDLQNNIATTEHDVRFVGLHGEIRGRGLQADLKQQQLRLLHEVSARYERP